MNKSDGTAHERETLRCGCQVRHENRTDTRKQRASNIRNTAAVPVGFLLLLCSCVSHGEGELRQSRRDLQTRQAILTVGEGDFAFSVALRARLDSMNGDYRLMATCFESRNSVLTKYPHSSSLLTRLERHPAVMMAYGVDATNLSNTVCSLECPFDLIIFNFPHSGTEDFRRHQALLAHFFASAKILLTSCGQIQVALASDQPRLWAVQEMAALSGMHLLEARTFNPEHEFPGYTVRRTTRQKSFRRTRPSGNRRVDVQAHRFTFSPCPAAGPESERHRCRRSAGRRASHTVWLPAPSIPPRPTLDRSASAETRFLCEEAETPIKEGGIRMPAADEAPYPRSSVHSCADCSRCFESGGALTQHHRAKHGKRPDIKPDWFTLRSVERGLDVGRRRQSAPVVEDRARWCAVCSMVFTNEADLEAHMRSLQPIQDPEYRCQGCERRFFEQRALFQHSNVCAALISKA